MTAAELDSSSNGDLAKRFDLTEGQVDRLRGAYALGFSFLASSRARAQVLRNAAASGIAKPLRAAKWNSIPTTEEELILIKFNTNQENHEIVESQPNLSDRSQRH